VTALAAKLTTWWRSREDDLGDVWPFLFVANVLYLFLLGNAPLWYDEANSAWFVELPLTRMVAAIAGDTHPPLYYLLLVPIVRFFGESTIALRLPSVLFAMLTLYIVRQIARELNLSRAAQIIALGLMVLSPFQLHYAQEARMYALFQVLVLGATLAALRKQLLRFALLSALSLWTHNYGLFYLAVNCGVLAWVVWQTKPRMKVFETGLIVSIVGGAAVALWLPWALVLFGQMRAVAGGYWIQPVTPGGLVYAFNNLLYVFTLPPYLAPMGTIIAVGLLTWLMIKTLETRAPEALLLAWIVTVPALLVVFVSIVWKPILLYRGLAPSLPALFLLSGWAFAQLPRARQLYAAILIVPLFVSAIVGQYLWTPDQKGARDNQLLADIRDQWQEGDLIVHPNGNELVGWHPVGADLPQVTLPRHICPPDVGGVSEATFNAYGIQAVDPETLSWRRVWFIDLVFPMITQCEVNMSQVFLAAHPHQLAFSVEHSQFLDFNVWLVTR